VICDLENCENEFEPKTHNQKYCSDQCCKIATNIKIKQKYHENKARRNGAIRICSNNGCNMELSRYNKTNKCYSCDSKKEFEDRNNILKLIGHVSS